MARRKVRWSSPQAALVAAALTGAGLGIALVCLAGIGPPPLIFDDFWVNSHRDTVGMLLASVGLALFASLAALLMGRKRVVVILLWVVAAGLSVTFFGDRLETVYRVLVHHTRQQHLSFNGPLGSVDW